MKWGRLAGPSHLYIYLVKIKTKKRKTVIGVPYLSPKIRPKLPVAQSGYILYFNIPTMPKWDWVVLVKWLSVVRTIWQLILLVLELIRSIWTQTNCSLGLVARCWVSETLERLIIQNQMMIRTYFALPAYFDNSHSISVKVSSIVLNAGDYFQACSNRWLQVTQLLVVKETLSMCRAQV